MSVSSQSILVISPHPDDESLGCGGTIKLLTESGVQVDVIYLTTGELGCESPEAADQASKVRLSKVRMEEAREACRLLGVANVDFLDGIDGRVGDQPHIAEKLQARLTLVSYSRVFCPWPQEKHPDHAAAFRWLRKALVEVNVPIQIWLYEVWTPLRPNTCVPIDTTIESKAEAIRAHRSQLACLDYLSAFRGLAAYRSLSCAGSRYAEAFIAGDRESIIGATWNNV